MMLLRAPSTRTTPDVRTVTHMGEHKEQYLFDDRDRQLVRSAITLLQKMSRAPFVKPAELVSIGKALHVLSTLPDITEDIDVTIDLSGPTRRYGDHEIPLCYCFHATVYQIRSLCL